MTLGTECLSFTFMSRFLALYLAHNSWPAHFLSKGWIYSEKDGREISSCWQRTNYCLFLTNLQCLNLTVPPLLSGDAFQTIGEDKDVRLVCDVKSNPPAQMTWYKNNSVLILEKGRHQIQETRESFQLSITKVKKSDSGVYSCVASSSLKTETMDFHLVVTGNSS